MNKPGYLNVRPTAVTVAIVLIAVTTVPKIVVSFFSNQWGDASQDAQIGFFLLSYGVPLWFVFRRRNWARWLVVILIAIGSGASLVIWARYYQTFSGFWAIWFWFSYSLDLIAAIALLCPSSNEWLRNPKDPLEPPPVAP